MNKNLLYVLMAAFVAPLGLGLFSTKDTVIQANWINISKKQISDLQRFLDKTNVVRNAYLLYSLYVKHHTFPGFGLTTSKQSIDNYKAKLAVRHPYILKELDISNGQLEHMIHVILVANQAMLPIKDAKPSKNRHGIYTDVIGPSNTDFSAKDRQEFIDYFITQEPSKPSYSKAIGFTVSQTDIVKLQQLQQHQIWQALKDMRLPEFTVTIEGAHMTSHGIVDSKILQQIGSSHGQVDELLIASSDNMYAIYKIIEYKEPYYYSYDDLQTEILPVFDKHSTAHPVIQAWLLYKAAKSIAAASTDTSWHTVPLSQEQYLRKLPLDHMRFIPIAHGYRIYKCTHTTIADDDTELIWKATNGF